MHRDLPHDIYRTIFADLIPARVRRLQEAAARCIQDRFRVWLNDLDKQGCHPICTDRHGFVLNIGDIVGDYTHPGFQMRIELIEVELHEGTQMYDVIGRVTHEANNDVYGAEGEEDVCVASSTFATDQGNRASFCEVCEHHFHPEHVTWLSQAVPFLHNGEPSECYSACRSCMRKVIVPHSTLQTL